MIRTLLDDRSSRRAPTTRRAVVWLALAAIAFTADTAHARIGNSVVDTAGDSTFVVRKVASDAGSWALEIAFSGEGGFDATDALDNVYTGSWDKDGRKIALDLSPGGTSAFEAEFTRRARAIAGAGSTVVVDSISLKARLNKKKTKLRVVGELRGTATTDGGDTRNAIWLFKLKGDAPPKNGTGSFAVAGSIVAAESSYTDSDLNDIATTPVPNNTAATAQLIPAPATVGGYVNRPFSGFDGNSFESGDPFDIYEVELTAGAVISLTIGEDASIADLDLDLADEDGFILDSSAGVDSVEILVAPADGRYLVQVRAFELCDCGSTYVLTLGQPVPAETSTAGERALRLSDDFVPGQAIVVPRAKALPAGVASASAATSFAAGLGMRALGGEPDREMLMSVSDAGDSLAALSALGVARDEEDAVGGLTLRRDAEWRERFDTLQAVKAMRRRTDVATADLNYVRHPLATPDDEFYSFQWHYPQINLPQAWDVTTGSPDVIVAVVDTGVLLDHPDLQGQLVDGFDFIRDASNARDGNGIDSNPDDPGDRAFGDSSSFHGTHVAGTVAAASDNGQGVAGVAWDARIMPLRTLGRRGGTDYDIVQAVRYAAGLSNDSRDVPDDPADVINLSLGGAGFSQSAQNAYLAARAAGLIVVAAAGNESSSRRSYPAAYDGVVSVSAVDLRSRLAPYSNFGSTIDVAAPGGDVRVDRNGDGFADGVLSSAGDDAGSGPIDFRYTFENGTSMAAPHVAGVAALMLAVAPDMTPDQFDGLLDGSLGRITTDLGAPGRDDSFGHGLIDARAAVLAAQDLAGAEPPTPDPVLSATPTALNFASSLQQLTFDLRNSGEGDLEVTAVTDDRSWISVTPEDGDPLGTYRVTVDRSGLGDGLYRGTITASSNANDVQIAVIMRVGLSLVSDTGPQYVLLVDPDTFTPVAQSNVLPEDGRYEYLFGNVPAGRYYLFGGSDFDNDGYLCHGGEACVGYPNLDLLVPVRITGNRTDLDFATGFLQSISAVAPTGVPGWPTRGIRLLDAGPGTTKRVR